jgi:regulator of replication initiation timing
MSGRMKGETEVERLHADNEQGRINLAHYRETIDALAAENSELRDRLKRVEALADEWEHEDRTNGPTGNRVEELRAALRGES